MNIRYDTFTIFTIVLLSLYSYKLTDMSQKTAKFLQKSHNSKKGKEENYQKKDAGVKLPVGVFPPAVDVRVIAAFGADGCFPPVTGVNDRIVRQLHESGPDAVD